MTIIPFMRRNTAIAYCALWIAPYRVISARGQKCVAKRDGICNLVHPVFTIPKREQLNPKNSREYVSLRRAFFHGIKKTAALNVRDGYGGRKSVAHYVGWAGGFARQKAPKGDQKKPPSPMKDWMVFIGLVM
ncbi:MAG: hypothetical protein PHY54_14410 [Methylococcales bacterium]|nr:hypothetical protein [Methylococcales bacterium]